MHKKLKIGRFLIRKKEKKIAGQKLLPIKPLIPKEDKNTEKEWELEGCHINGDYLDFGITACKKGKKKIQYIHYYSLIKIFHIHFFLFLLAAF